ncbi:hypothetical protein PFISCL1PPCAC_14063 [Pristionchus fissidentatus]|uniref:SXP/RAL-2 family protein Ani s 5-like cation-binding domain-containing protein n=1 Tax=Pristionchus fissidentatus TaxID=1538716 RepID=A0AAV5VTH9_9BILA|nr:hypothetical protein PFISCL1PPCAC_14063 [Pristionchus fissidentatus]
MKLALVLLFSLTVTQSVFFAKSMQKRVKEDFKPRLPFFANCTSDEIHEFFSITKNRTLPKHEVMDRTRQWAEKRGNETLEIYSTYVKTLDQKKDAAFKMLSTIANDLPKLLQKYHEIRVDLSISGEEEDTQLFKLFDLYSESTKAAFIQLVSAHYPRGINEAKKTPFIGAPRKNGESRNRGPYGHKDTKNKTMEEEAL